MVDIFKKEICNYCQNTECDKSELVEVEADGLKIYKCLCYKKKSSKITSTGQTLPVKIKKNIYDNKNKR